MEIMDLLKEAADNLQRILDVDTVVGAPIKNGDITVIPVSKMTVGICSGGGDFDKSALKNKDLPIGGVGGGANISPVGFIILDGDNVRFIKTEGTDKWSECLNNVMDFLSR
jgi:uncharacterized spore protein YtfJ